MSGIGTKAAALALWLAAAACGSMGEAGGGGGGGFDASKEQTKAGTAFAAPYQFLKVQSIKPDKERRSVKFVLLNEGDRPLESELSMDVQFGFEAPPDSFAPYVPDFQPFDIDIADLPPKKASKEFEVKASPESKGNLIFVKLTPAGAEIRSSTGTEYGRETRSGTRFLNDTVECVAVKGDLAAVKPWLEFTLRNVGSDQPVGNLRYKIEFYKWTWDKDGMVGKPVELPASLRRPKSVPEPLGARTKEVKLEIKDLPENLNLAGCWIQLRLKKPS